MRQAGRYLPEYHKVKGDRDFFETCRDAEIASTITIQPIDRFKLDAAIIFSDILVIPQAMGCDIKMVDGKGPVFTDPVRKPEDLKKINLKPDIKKELDWAFKAITLTRHKLNGKVPLLGFVGAPWTLLVYMTEGQGSKMFRYAKEWIYNDYAQELLQALCDNCIEFLAQQVVAGAQMLQVFESWAETLGPEEFKNFSLPYLKQIAEKLPNRLKELGQEPVPLTVFAKGAWYALDDLCNTKYDVVSLDWLYSPEEAVKVRGDRRITLQGNLDPGVIYGSDEVIESKVKSMIHGFGKQQYIINFGHGTHPFMKPEKIEYFIEMCHKYNQKRTAKNLPPVDEDEFDRIIEEESIESLSGDEEEYLNTRSPFILFDHNGETIGIYKAVFKNEPNLHEVQKYGKSALFMVGGGHFAGAIVENNKFIKTKTFHRYTTRRKQGGSQSASDNSRGKANSAGSSIRRYNEQALAQEIKELIKSWELNECENIFIRANGVTNRKIIFDAVEKDSRVRNFPFTTKRATTSELKRAWDELMSVHHVELPKVDQKQEVIKEQPKIIKIKEKQDELIPLLKKQNKSKIIQYVKEHNIDVNTHKVNNTPLLHFATTNNLHHTIQVLVADLHASPLVFTHKYPAELADKETRKVFQQIRFKLGENYCDWDKAKVLPAKSKEQFDKELKEQQEKERLDKQQRIKQELAKKAEMELKKPKFQSVNKLGQGESLNGLTDQQKMRIMREQRARAAEARMK
ncbi:unnamed protein product [Candida verbasci]|uniref:Uroporphyrinogen decarboxylase n=1 Tax=Candida verbasci TaxID=1227364 RepID=A0A9W4TWQ5_9ASCO|nr:unnamed protein product [Candida verbasci]